MIFHSLYIITSVCLENWHRFGTAFWFWEFFSNVSDRQKQGWPFEKNSRASSLHLRWLDDWDETFTCIFVPCRGSKTFLPAHINSVASEMLWRKMGLRISWGGSWWVVQCTDRFHRGVGQPEMYNVCPSCWSVCVSHYLEVGHQCCLLPWL